MRTRSTTLRLLPAIGLALALTGQTVRGAATPSSTRAPDQSVAFQVDVAHSGRNVGSTLVPPLTKKWTHDFGSGALVSYPLLAEGRLLVTVSNSSGKESVVSLDEATGAVLWKQDITGTYAFVNAAYDGGKVFAVNSDGIVKGFDAATGSLLWSVDLPVQYLFTSPPTAFGGRLFVDGSGSGGTLYALDETDGTILWSQGIENGDHTSPALGGGGVYVSPVCLWVYKFNPVTGALIWSYSGDCSGGGGKTPAYSKNRLYVRDPVSSPPGWVFDARTGSVLLNFSVIGTPFAILGARGFIVSGGALQALDLSDGSTLWTFTGDGQLSSAPIVVNGEVYVGSGAGTLYAVDPLDGHQVWSTPVGASIPPPDEQNAVPTTGLGAGDGLLVVPAGTLLVAYSN